MIILSAKREGSETQSISAMFGNLDSFGNNRSKD
jgi:hypothetical protein